MVRSLTQTVDNGSGGTATHETSYGLDSAGRVDTVTNTSDGTETTRLRYRFSDPSDSPTSIQSSSDGGASWASTRYLTIPGLGMIGSTSGGLTTFQITNLHGDVVATQKHQSNTLTIDTYAETDEFGNSIQGNPRRYGWLGAEQRSTDAVGGMVLMGARVYNPASGQFLQNDPVLNGGATRYAYPYDPVNMRDLTGESWFCGSTCKRIIVSGMAIVIGDIASVLCYGTSPAGYALCKGAIGGITSAAKYFITQTWAYGRSVTTELLLMTVIQGAIGFMTGATLGGYKPSGSKIVGWLTKIGGKASGYLRSKGFTRFPYWIDWLISRMPTQILARI